MNKEEVLSVLRDFKIQNAHKYGIIELGIFGSVARDESHEDSDVDICIRTKTPNPFVLVHMKEDIEKLIRCHVDIIRIREKMNPFLKKRIEKEMIYV